MTEREIILTKPIEYTYEYSDDDDKVVFDKLIVSGYQHNSNIALVLMPVSNDPSEYVTISTNIRQLNSEAGLFALNVNDITVENIFNQLVDQKIIEETELIPLKSGFVTYPIYRLCV